MNAPLRVEMTRVFSADRLKVYDAWTRPELISKWLSPYYLTVTEVTAEVKAGGAFRIDMDGKSAEQDLTGYATGTYREVVPGEKLCFTWTWHFAATGMVTEETVITVTFKDVDGGTELYLVHDKFLTTEGYEGYKSGWVSCFEKLEKLLGA